MPFTGVGVALTTLFGERLAVDTAATAEHAARLVDLGLTAVIVAGTTGEAAALDPDERMDLVSAVRAAVPDEVPVVAGTGAASAHGAAALTQQAVAAGADAVLALSPPRSSDLRAYYTAVGHAAGDVPVLAYHFPAVSAPGIPVGALDHLPIAGCKDSSGDPNRLLDELTGTGVPIYVGNSALLALAGPLGAAGAILAAANVAPELCLAAFGGDASAQRELAPIHAATRLPLPEGTKLEMARRWGTPITARIR
ncbi:MAG: dihydrodipicolinate synthase family protein [Acidimicrobiia bacterium]